MLVALSVLLPALASAQGRPVAPRDEAPCTPEGSALCTGQALLATLAQLDRRLDRRHATLRTLVRGDTTAAGRDVRIEWAVDTLHATWRRLRRDDCELHGALTRAGGSWPSTWALDCEVAATRARLATVDAAIRCIERLPIARREFERFECLTRLRLLARDTRGAGPG